jgi:CheY-like chemotaxis protein
LGLNVDIAENGAVGLALINKKNFNIVFMDIQMPVMDGLEATSVIRKIEQEEGLPRIPVIAMTAHALEGDRERCIEGGMDGYITKPIHIHELTDVILKWATASD